MNCEKCQELLSDFLDGTLSNGDRALLSKHLDACLDCQSVRHELQLIVGAAHECREQLYEPPDARAMWLRISNVIEGERAFSRAASAATPARARESFWSRLFNRRWELTLPQMAAAVSAIAVSAALATVLGVQSLWDNNGGAPAMQSSTPTTDRTAPGEETYPNAYLRQQNARISYLEQRVEQRKASWNPRMRESFERSLSVLDRAVLDSLDELKRNPHDEVSEEVLNSALRDKMELLREFSDQ